MKKKINTDKIDLTNRYDLSILHNEQSETLANLIINKSSHHALLITGVKGIGKLDFICDVIRKVFTQNINDAEKLQSVNWQITNNSYSNLILIKKLEGKKNIAIEDIRKIGNFLTLSASDDNCKIVVIDSVDDLNSNSANALLKIMEEPPNNCYLFLINHNEAKLHKTIKSRCHRIKLQIPQHAKTIKNIPTNVNSELFDKLLYISGNSPGLAMKLANYDLLGCYSDLLNLLSNDINYTEIAKFVDKVNSLANEDSNLMISIMINNIIINIIKTLNGVNYNLIIDPEAKFIDILLSKRKINQWFDIYEWQRKLMNDQINSNLDLKQVFLIIVGRIC